MAERPETPSEVDDEDARFWLPEWVKPGVTYRYDFGPDNPHTGRVFHVRGIVDGRAVIREWSKRKQRWIYTVEGGVEFQVMAANLKPESS